MNAILEQLQNTLLTKYEPGYANLYVQRAKANSISVEDFKKQLPYKLPELFYEYYDWMIKKDFPAGDLSTKAYVSDQGQQTNRSLLGIVMDTQAWEELQKEDPSREWKEGFVVIASWNSAYDMVIDTQGKINGKKGVLAYWDFKGGSEYIIRYQDFESYLKTRVRLLEEKLYFGPSLSDSEADEDFTSGDTRDKIDQIVTEMNGEPEIVEWV